MKNITSGMDPEIEHFVSISELYWSLLENEAELSDKSVREVLQLLLSQHFNIGRGGGTSEQIALTIYYDVDDFLRRLSHEELHFEN